MQKSPGPGEYWMDENEYPKTNKTYNHVESSGYGRAHPREYGFSPEAPKERAYLAKLDKKMQKDDKVNPNTKYEEDLDDLPFYLRGCIQNIIDKRLQQRIDEEMQAFKEEVKQEISEQKAQN